MPPPASLLVNGTALLSPQTGIGRYTREICSHLAAGERKWISTYYYGYFSKTLYNSGRGTSGEETAPFFFPAQLLKKSPFLKCCLRRGLTLAATVSRRKFDLYWEPAIVPLAPLLKRGRITVATMHDFSWLHHPEWHPAERVEEMTRNFRENIGKIDAVITDSNFVREEALSILPLPPEKIRSIHCGVDHSFFFPRSSALVEETLRSLSLPERYILQTGTFEPRKNILRTIRGWAGLPEKIRREFPLLLAGAEGWKNREIEREVAATPGVISLGRVSEEILAVLYSGASLFVYPSLYEGFGLPLLEAMACGAPVLASRASSLPEVCGDGARLFDPQSMEELTSSMEELLNDEKLRHSLSCRGLSRAAGFSWRKSAEEHSSFFASLLEGRNCR